MEMIQNQVRRQEEEDRQAKERQKEKLRKFEKDLRKQHKIVKKQYVQRMRDEMEEGELLKVQAVAAIQAEEIKEKAKREKAMKLNDEMKDINARNREIKARQVEQQRNEN